MLHHTALNFTNSILTAAQRSWAKLTHPQIVWRVCVGLGWLCSMLYYELTGKSWTPPQPYTLISCLPNDNKTLTQSWVGGNPLKQRQLQSYSYSTQAVQAMRNSWTHLDHKNRDGKHVCMCEVELGVFSFHTSVNLYPVVIRTILFCKQWPNKEFILNNTYTC